MATKRKTSKKTIAKKKTKNKKEMIASPLYEYMSNISAEEKFKFYEEAYRKYMERLEKVDSERFRRVSWTKYDLSAASNLILLYIFLRIVPTLSDNDPIEFLYEAMDDATIGKFDKLCVFLQIAGYRWTLIEKSYKRSLKSRSGREGNKWWNKKEGKLLVPVFESMRESIKEEDKLKFKIAYKNILLPWLIENWKDSLYLELKRMEKDLPEYKDEINYIIIHYNAKDVDEVKNSLEIFEPIKDFYRSKYKDWSEYQAEERIYFESAKQFFLLSELEETIWKKLDPWPIERCKKEFSMQRPQFSLEENIVVNPHEVAAKILVDSILSPHSEANPYHRAQFDGKRNLSVLSEADSFHMTPEEKASFYLETFYFFKKIQSLKKRDDPIKPETLFDENEFEEDGIEKKLHSISWAGMVEYMYQRIAPSLCDDKPLHLLDNAITYTENNDYLWLSVFMQISSFRWGIIENSIKGLTNSRHGHDGNKWTLTGEAKIISPLFEKMRKESNYVYDVDCFNKGYENLIIPELLRNWKLLSGKLNNVISRHPDYHDLNEQIEESYNSKDFSLATKLISEIEPLRRSFRKKYIKICSLSFDDCFIFFKSIKRFFLLSELKKTIWKELEPWHIQDHQVGESIFPYKEILNLLEESIVLNKE